MPGIYVFPGGRLSTADRRPSGYPEPLPPPPYGTDQSTRRRLPVFARAAVRETYEETGLVLGTAAGPDFHPSLQPLEYIARAITPSGNPIRYHARFFLADAAAVHGRLRSNGELLDLAWVPIPRAFELNVIDVTQVVLREVASRLAGTAAQGVPLIHYHRGVQRIRRD